MDPKKRREICQKGGRVAHQKGVGHEWTSEEAREAGRKGGMAGARKRAEAKARREQAQATQTQTRTPDVSDTTVPADKTEAV